MIRLLAIVPGLLLAVCGAYAGLLIWYDGDTIQSAVSDRLSERYGVSFRAQVVERTFSARPLIRIEKMRIANEKYSDQPLIQVESASFRLRPWTLLVGPITLDDVVVDGIKVSIPVDDDGALYWDPLVQAVSDWLYRFDWSLPDVSVRNLHSESRHVSRGNDLLVSAKGIEASIPRPADLTLSATGVSANLETALPLRVKGTAKLGRLVLQRKSGPLPVTFSASGWVGDKPLDIEASGGNLLAGDPMARDPVQATINLGHSTAEIRGTMSRGANMHLVLYVTYDEPAEGDRPALHVEGGVSDPGTNWRFTDVRATQGDSTLSGVLEIRNRNGRRLLDGSATVTHVEYPEIGTEPDKRQRKVDAKEKGLRDLLPKGDLYSHLLQAIDGFDAEFEVRAEKSRLLGIPFDWITIRTRLDRGALSATIEDSRIRDSSLKGLFSVTPGENETTMELSAELRNAKLSALVAGIETLDGVTGRFDGDLRLQAMGNDTPAILDSTGGRLALFLENGAMPDPLAQRIAGDVFTTVFVNFDEDDKTPIRCAVVDFDVDGGIASAQRMVLDTGEFLLFGDGKINLQKGTLDLEFVPRAKDFSLVSINLPFRIHGPLDDVKYNPDVSRGVESLLTPIEFGSRKEVSCTPPMSASRSRN